MGDGPCGHRSGIRLKYFFHQHRAVLVRCAGVAPGRHRRRGSLLRSGLGGCHRNAGATTNASAIVGVYRTSPTPRRFFCTCPSKVPHTLLLQQGALRRSGRNFGEQTACQAEGSSRLPFLAPQDPEELGTDEPPDVSKSARDRPVHTRAYGTVTWGKGPRRAVGDRVRPYLHRSQRRAVSGGR
jgi:hypothetical protein